MTDAPQPFNALNRATLAGQVRGEIERLILAGDLASGEKLNEVALAERIGVSRGTVREAIRALSDSGLIELISNRGAFVKRLTLDEIANLYDVRCALFSMACESIAARVAETPDPALMAALERNMDLSRQAARDDDSPAYYALNVEFHAMLLEAGRNPRATAIYQGVVKEMHLFRKRGLAVTQNKSRSIGEHEAIVAAIVAGDPEAARRAAHTHIQNGKGRFYKTLGGDAGSDPAALQDAAHQGEAVAGGD